MPNSTELNSNRVFGAPLRYIQGPGALNEIGGVASLAGKNALLVADQFVLDLIGGAITESCRRSEVSVQTALFNGEITPAEIERLCSVVSASPVDVVIAAGGGKGIDAGKAVSHHLNVEVITLPTIASNDAPTSKIFVVYAEDHRLLGVQHMTRNPLAVVVDTGLIAGAPKKLLLAGIGDAISKKFEVAQCFKAGAKTMYGARGTLAANALAELCYTTLLESSQGAIEAVEQKQPNASLEALVEATVLLSGLCFENGGLSIAHAMTRGLTAIPETAHELHGLQVAYGLLIQLQLENRSAGFIRELRQFYAQTGLPQSLRDLGLKQAATPEQIKTIATQTLTAPYIANFERSLEPADFVAAIEAVESYV